MRFYSFLLCLLTCEFTAHLSATDQDINQTDLSPDADYSEMEKRWSVWSSGSLSRLKDSFSTSQQKGDLTSSSVGAEYALTPALRLGLSYERDLSWFKSAAFNSKDHTQGNMGRTDLGYDFLPWLSGQLSSGYGLSRTKSTNTLTPSYSVSNASTWQLGGSLSASKAFPLFTTTVQGGYTYSQTHQKSFLDSTGLQTPSSTDKNGSGVLSLRISHPFFSQKTIITPYVLIGMDYDFIKTDTASYEIAQPIQNNVIYEEPEYEPEHRRDRSRSHRHHPHHRRHHHGHHGHHHHHKHHHHRHHKNHNQNAAQGNGAVAGLLAESPTNTKMRGRAGVWLGSGVNIDFDCAMIGVGYQYYKGHSGLQSNALSLSLNIPF